MANGLWQRTRDTRSVEPSGPPPRQYNSEKIQSKPPSGRRHSTVGVEYDKRHKPSNLPPRLRKKFESENNFVPHTEEVWDGNSVMFQGSSNHLKNPSYHQMNYMTASQPHLDNNAGYFTLPNRPRGRGRLQQHDYEHTAPGFRSPGSSRPASPPVRYDSRPQTPRNEEDYRNSNEMPRKGYLERRKSESREMNREMNERRSYNNNKRREPRRRRYNSRRDSNANQNNKFNDEFERRSDREEDTTPTPQQINEFSESLEAQLSPVSPEMTNEERSQPINHIGQTYDKSLVSFALVRRIKRLLRSFWTVRTTDSEIWNHPKVVHPSQVDGAICYSPNWTDLYCPVFLGLEWGSWIIGKVGVRGIKWCINSKLFCN